MPERSKSVGNSRASFLILSFLPSLDNSYFGHIPIYCGVRQRGVLSSYIFNACIKNVLSKISTTCLLGPSDLISGLRG